MYLPPFALTIKLNKMKNFDVIVIGSGQAGTPLVFKMASAGRKVAFIEKKHFGGTCVNDGCTPTKAYVASARRIWVANQGDGLGICILKGAFVDLKKVKERKDSLVKESAYSIGKGVEDNDNIAFFRGEARFTGEKTVSVNNTRLRADEIYINVGARAVIPEPFRELDYLTNESILQLEELPEHLIIIGGSYVGLEFAQIFKRFGSRVTVIEKDPKIIGREDDEISGQILDFLKDEGIEFRLSSTCIQGIKNKDGSVTVKLECDEGDPEVTGSHILLAVGRRPNTDTLNPEAGGIEIDERGYIRVDDYLETSVKGVFALGDCNGRGAFTHTSYNDYEIIAANKFSGESRKVTDRIMTYCLYTDPPLGRAGMNKSQARDRGHEIMEAKMPMDKINRAREKGETRGSMSVIVDSGTKKILGASVLGVGGDEIISGILNIMYAGVPYTVIRDSVIPHPTVSELIPSMLEGLKES
jgi:pyruvate/2-oxoglutarate dehydrogenase complex dihydrolipoamide dehydrogenase (E3) component